MQNRRLLFTVIIKLLIVSGFLLLIFVFMNSLFTKDDSVRNVSSQKVSIAILNIADMQKGQIKKIRWNNKEVAILLRQNFEKLKSNKGEFLNDDMHHSINTKTRSIKVEYFVYINTGDSRNCPLFYSGGELKDICSSNKFDEAGISLYGNSQGFRLKVPPHYFDDTKLVIGKWQP